MVEGEKDYNPPSVFAGHEVRRPGVPQEAAYAGLNWLELVAKKLPTHAGEAVMDGLSPPIRMSYFVTQAVTGDAGGVRGNSMLFMVIETFRNGDAVPVYRRFRERGTPWIPRTSAAISSHSGQPARM